MEFYQQVLNLRAQFCVRKALSLNLRLTDFDVSLNLLTLLLCVLQGPHMEAHMNLRDLVRLVLLDPVWTY